MDQAAQTVESDLSQVKGKLSVNLNSLIGGSNRSCGVVIFSHKDAQKSTKYEKNIFVFCAFLWLNS